MKRLLIAIIIMLFILIVGCTKAIDKTKFDYITIEAQMIKKYDNQTYLGFYLVDEELNAFLVIKINNIKSKIADDKELVGTKYYIDDTNNCFNNDYLIYNNVMYEVNMSVLITKLSEMEFYEANKTLYIDGCTDNLCEVCIAYTSLGTIKYYLQTEEKIKSFFDKLSKVTLYNVSVTNKKEVLRVSYNDLTYIMYQNDDDYYLFINDNYYKAIIGNIVWLKLYNKDNSDSCEGEIQLPWV